MGPKAVVQDGPAPSLEDRRPQEPDVRRRRRPVLVGAVLVASVGLGAAAYLARSSGPSTRRYPWHTDITATTFWVGETFRDAADGSQVCSAYQRNWAQLWAPPEDTISTARDPTDCNGSPIGGCDGRRGELIDTDAARLVECRTEPRTVRSDGWDYFPSWTTDTKRPRENPFYVDLPYDDIGDGFAGRCQVIPWADDPGFAGNCLRRGFSYLKNRWVEIVGPSGRSCYGQVQDAGPSDVESDDPLKYRDAPYVFGADDARPSNRSWNGAGIDVSPALNGCLGFAELDGDSDKVSWRWVEAADVPPGPWTKVVTTSQPNRGTPVPLTSEYLDAIIPPSARGRA